MPQTLGQLNASRNAIEQAYQEPSNALFQRLSPKPDLWDGFTRVYEPLEETDLPPGVVPEQYPSENKIVQNRVHEHLARLRPLLVRYVDTETSMSASNAPATGDVRLNGEVIAAGVPATALLFWHNRLAELFTQIERLPVLEAKSSWDWDANRNCYVTPPVQTRAVKPQTRAVPAFQPTEHQPGQYIAVQEEMRTGTWTRTGFSGSMPLEQKQQMLARIREAQIAVKAAQVEANSANQAIRMDIFGPVADYIFGDLSAR
jgi:hypothetical protein